MLLSNQHSAVLESACSCGTSLGKGFSTKGADLLGQALIPTKLSDHMTSILPCDPSKSETFWKVFIYQYRLRRNVEKIRAICYMICRTNSSQLMCSTIWDQLQGKPSSFHHSHFYPSSCVDFKMILSLNEIGSLFFAWF